MWLQCAVHEWRCHAVQCTPPWLLDRHHQQVARGPPPPCVTVKSKFMVGSAYIINTQILKHKYTHTHAHTLTHGSVRGKISDVYTHVTRVHACARAHAHTQGSAVATLLAFVLLDIASALCLLVGIIAFSIDVNADFALACVLRLFSETLCIRCSDTLCIYCAYTAMLFVRASMCACVRACVRVCMRACVCACVRAYVFMCVNV